MVDCGDCLTLLGCEPRCVRRIIQEHAEAERHGQLSLPLADAVEQPVECAKPRRCKRRGPTSPTTSSKDAA